MIATLIGMVLGKRQGGHGDPDTTGTRGRHPRKSLAFLRIIASFLVPDWHMHRDAERYMEGLLGYARPIDGPPLPGDIALFRFGRTFSHGAIIVEWPRLVHAYWAIGVVWGDATLHPLKDRPVRFFSPFHNEAVRQ